MKSYKVIRFFILFALILSGSGAFAQKEGKQKSVKQQRKEFLELQEERAKEGTDVMDKKRQKHLDIQTKETRKRMKQNEKKVRRLRAGKHKDTWWQRTFRKKSKR